LLLLVAFDAELTASSVFAAKFTHTHALKFYTRDYDGLVWFCLLVFNGTFSTNRLYIVPKAYEIYVLQGRGKTHSNINKPNKRKIHTISLTWALWR